MRSNIDALVTFSSSDSENSSGRRPAWAATAQVARAAVIHLRHSRRAGAVASRMARLQKRRPSANATREMIRRIAKQITSLPLSSGGRFPASVRAPRLFPPAGVFAELLERCHLEGFRYSELGLRDGILAQMARIRSQHPIGRA